MQTAACDLSVAMPAFNTGKAIETTVLSLVENLRPFNFEIVIVNDGSTDDTGKILRRLARKYPFIRTHKQANQGVGPAKQAALALCRGRYVWIRDSNDEVPPGAFAGFEPGLLEQGADILIFDYDQYDRQGRLLGMIPLDQDIYQSLPAGLFDPSARPELLYSSHMTWNKFYRRAFLAEQGISLGGGRAHEDIIIHVKSLCLARSGLRLARPILNEVAYSGQLSARPELRLEALPAFAEAEAFLAALPPDPARQTAWRVFKANHLYWIYNNCGEYRERLRDYYQAFLVAIPSEELLDFIKCPALRADVRRYALEVRGINSRLADKLYGAPSGREKGLLARLGRWLRRGQNSGQSPPTPD